MMLQGKVGVITGATSGLGRATAHAMAREGAAVVLTGRDRTAGEAAAGEIRDGGGRAVFETVDVVDESAVERMVARAVAEFGRLDIAYNKAQLVNRMRYLVTAAARQARSLAPGARPTRWNQLR